MYVDHIWIVPVPRAGEWNQSILIVSVIIDYAQNTVPRVLDVVKVAPQMASFLDGLVIWLKIQSLIQFSKAEEKNNLKKKWYLHLISKLIIRPRTRIYHRASRFVQVVTKFWVTLKKMKG